MSKSVLVIGTFHSFRKINCRDIEDLSAKPDWCPLKPLPEKITRVAVTDHWNSIKAGWNNCIDAITGGNADD